MERKEAQAWVPLAGDLLADKTVLVARGLTVKWVLLSAMLVLSASLRDIECRIERSSERDCNC